MIDVLENAPWAPAFLGEPNDLTLFDQENVSHFTLGSREPQEDEKVYLQRLFLDFRESLVENEYMEKLEQSVTYRVYDDGAISIQPHIRGNGFEYIATLEPGPPHKRKSYATYTVSRLRFNIPVVTGRIMKMRAEYDKQMRIGNHDADAEAKLVGDAYTSLLHEVYSQFSYFEDPWLTKPA